MSKKVFYSMDLYIKFTNENYDNVFLHVRFEDCTEPVDQDRLLKTLENLRQSALGKTLPESDTDWEAQYITKDEYDRSQKRVVW